MNKYRNVILSYLLVMEDVRLREFINLKRFLEVFIKGWKVWKRGEGEEEEVL